MFDKPTIRKVIAAIWIVAVASLCLSFYLAVQPFRTQALSEISRLEQSVVAKDWGGAQDHQQKVNSLWKQHKLLVQLNNVTPTVSRFEQNLAQVKDLIQHQEKSVLDFTGILKDAVKSLTSLSPTPEG